MKKRGQIVAVIGAVLIASAIVTAYSVIPSAGSSISGNDFFPSPESMFDTVSDKIRIDPGTGYTFSHTTTASQVPVMWGTHITDYKPDDHVSISISNIFGDKFGSFDEGDPIFIKSFVAPKVNTYNFYVENRGKEPLTAAMMFSESPEKSKALTDPNSPFFKKIVPFVMAVLVLIIGLAVIISGIILCVLDWRKSKNQSRYI